MTPFEVIQESARSWPSVHGQWPKLKSNCRSLAVYSITIKSLERLMELNGLEELSISTIRDAEVEAIACLKNLRTLLLGDIKVDSLKGLGGLRKLEVLGLHTAPKLTSLEGLEQFKKLRLLNMYHIPRVKSIEPLAELTKLTELSIQMSWGTDKKLQFESLDPIGKLRNLEILELIGVQPLDGSLSPLGKLNKLKKLEIGYFMPAEEYAKLAALLKYLDADCLRPYVESDDDEDFVCKKCKSKQVMLVGKASQRSKLFVCPSCNASLVERHVAIFEQYAGKPRKRK